MFILLTSDKTLAYGIHLCIANVIRIHARCIDDNTYYICSHIHKFMTNTSGWSGVLELGLIAKPFGDCRPRGQNDRAFPCIHFYLGNNFRPSYGSITLLT